MDFTEKEKEAIVWCMYYIADSDGKRNQEEITLMTEIIQNID